MDPCDPIWFVIAVVFLILSMGGLVTAAVLCFCRQRVPTPRHPHNTHNAQSQTPVSFPSTMQELKREIRVTYPQDAVIMVGDIPMELVELRREIRYTLMAERVIGIQVDPPEIQLSRELRVVFLPEEPITYDDNLVMEDLLNFERSVQRKRSERQARRRYLLEVWQETRENKLEMYLRAIGLDRNYEEPYDIFDMTLLFGL
ncbi:uncharacterized protein [Temnothorax nylanderi]|uniref:uncharacterized protein n=1 Tax=Temnothorax nylanderi TaxID=102681 RepID=UPI003A862F3D